MNMKFKQYKELIKKIPYGKQLPDAVYLHESALDSLPLELAKLHYSIIQFLLQNLTHHYTKVSQSILESSDLCRPLALRNL